MSAVERGTAAVSVDLVNVVPGAVLIPVGELQAGDIVHDVYGGRHELRTVRRLARGRVRTTRADGWVDVWSADATVAVLRDGIKRAGVIL